MISTGLYFAVNRKAVVELVDFLAKCLVTLLARLEELPLSSADFDNCSACLFLIEQLKLEANEEEMMRIFSQVPGFARSATLLLEHMSDEGTYLFIFLNHCD